MSEVVADARMFCRTEQSELIVTLCVEETQDDRRLFHRDFHLDLQHALLLKKSIDRLDLEQLQKMM